MRHDVDLRAKDRRYLLSPHNWMAFPFCPIKRYETATESLKEMETGVVMADSIFGGDDEIEVLLTNLFAFDPNAKTILYAGIDALLDDGWEVD